jgi:hypothetical protein
MAFGGLIGMACAWDDARYEGPTGNTLAAGTALMAMICILVVFGIATATVIAAKVERRGAPDRLILRLGLSIVA